MKAVIATALLLLTTSARAGSVANATLAALSTDSPYATQVGVSILREGGNAIDAAVAVAFAMGVVHPHSGTIGGGGFLLYYEAKTGSVWALDFQETAPAAVKAEGLRTGAATAGVPGTIAGLAAMHVRFGTRPWRHLLQPAITLARAGVRADADLASAVASSGNLELPEAAREALVSGRVPALAGFLDRLARAGADDFYRGALADRFVSAVRAAGGSISHRDLRNYAPVWRAPLRIRFRGYDIYAAPPPSGSGLVMAESLGIIDSSPPVSHPFDSAAGLHLLAEATRRAFIDRDQYAGDPAASRIAYRDVLSAERASTWRKSIRADRVTPTATLALPGALADSAHTTHATIADRHGNVAAITLTIGGDFGSGFLLPDAGFFLNSALRAFAPTGVNTLAPGRRALSSLCPTIVLQGGKPYLALGSSGGSSIPTTILQVLLRHLAGGEPLTRAISAPRYHQAATPDQIDYERAAPATLIDALNAMGHAVALRPAIGNVHAIMFTNGRMTAVADPRRGGAAGGF